MSLETRNLPGLITHSNPRRQLGYTPEARQFLLEKPKVVQRIRRLTRLMDTVTTPGDTVVDEDISLKVVKYRKSRTVYEVTIGDQTFFLKKVKDLNYTPQGGFQQAEATHEAKDRLEGIPWV